MTEPNINPDQAPPSVEERLDGKPRSTRKRTAIAVLLSLLIPGMGQLFNRQPRKGLWMAVTFPLLALIAGESRILLSFWGVVILAVIIVAWRLFIIADAAHIACVDSKTDRGFRNSRITVFFIAGNILLAAFLPTPGQFLGRYAYFRAFRLRSDSMCPTACQGERLIANMDAFKTKPPQRGDIIIFDYDSASSKEIYIKRVIAVAGDVVEPGSNGAILVNGTSLGRTEICGKPILQKYPHEEPSSFSSERIPERSLFVVGDNLEHSFDSRMPGFGLVRLDHVRGKPLFLYWSPGRSRLGCPIR